jgi:hypothetical protein
MKNIKFVLIMCVLLLHFFVLKAQSINNSLSNQDTALISKDTTHYVHVDSLRKQIVKAFLDSAIYPLKAKKIGDEGKVIIKITYQSVFIKNIEIIRGTARSFVEYSLSQIISIFFEKLPKHERCRDVHEITFPIIYILGDKKVNEEKDGWIYIIEKEPVKITKRKAY